MKGAVQLLTYVLATALTTHAQKAAGSQHPSGPVQQAVHQLEMLEQRVSDLTPDQVISLNSILLGETITLDSLHEHPSGDPKADGPLRHSIMHDADVHIYSLLNENQQVQYVIWKQEQRIKNLENSGRKTNKKTNNYSPSPILRIVFPTKTPIPPLRSSKSPPAPLH